MKCYLCPRSCGADREAGELGWCRCPALPHAARAARHDWEEPCLSGTRGSGAVFFSGCNLGCVYCQNREISRTIKGKSLDAPGLRELFARLADSGVHNLNLVTAAPYARTVAEALEGLPAYKMHCSVLAEEAIQSALEDYYSKHPEARPES